MIDELSLLVNAGLEIAVSNSSGLTRLLTKLACFQNSWWEKPFYSKQPAEKEVWFSGAKIQIGMSSRLTSFSFEQSTFSIGQKKRRDRPLSSHHYLVWFTEERKRKKGSTWIRWNGMNHNNMQKREELPGHTHLRKTLDRLHKTYSACHEGNVASYIPELAKANPDHFGVAVVGIDGEIYEAGETSAEFTIQSISKAFVFGLAVETHGRDAVLKKVGVEPSGDAFNSLELRSSRKPFNPMINAGAITDTGMITGGSVKDRMNKILRLLSDAAGRELRVDEDVYRSEKETGHRNRAIGHLLKNVDLIDGEVEEVLDLYFQQCSVLLNARDLAVMGATLANLGTNPVTGKEVLSFESVRDVLSVMFTCGMYDFAGEWAFRVGIPAKSGVGGGILAVINRQLGIGTYSPRLDSMGNSIRGIRLCTDLAEEMGLHIFNFTNPGSSFIKATFAKK